MKTIDFLPQKYHEKHARARAGIWRLLVVAMLGGVVAAASVGQVLHRNYVRSQIDELQPLYAEVQVKQTMLAQMQAELARETAAATLYAHLQTQWPRTRLVAAVALPATESLRIEQIHIVAIETPAAPVSSESATAATGLESMSPATRDLTSIRTAGASRVTRAKIVGTCEKASDVHDYLGQVEQSPLVQRAELVSLETMSADKERRMLRFTAQVKLHAPRGWSDSTPSNTTPASVTLTQSTRPTP